MLSDEWLSRYGLLENFNASVKRTGTWTTRVTAIALFYALRAFELKTVPICDLSLYNRLTVTKLTLLLKQETKFDAAPANSDSKTAFNLSTIAVFK